MNKKSNHVIGPESDGIAKKKQVVCLLPSPSSLYASFVLLPQIQGERLEVAHKLHNRIKMKNQVQHRLEGGV